MPVHPAEIIATRHLIGLSQQEFAEALDVSRASVKFWETGKHVARQGVVDDINSLRAIHDRETDELANAARRGVPIELPSGPRPRGWYVALGARVLDQEPDANLQWAP